MTKMSRLIGLAGLARSGKSTAACHLVEAHGFDNVASFATPLKRAARAMFDLSANEVEGMNYDRESPHPFWGISVREILQKLGTEAVRNVFGEQHWVRLMEYRLLTTDFGHEDVVITDVRFDNEVEMIQNMGGKVIGLVRTGNDNHARPHASEEMAAFRLQEVSDYMVYARDIPELQTGIDHAMEEFYGRPAPTGG